MPIPFKAAAEVAVAHGLTVEDARHLAVMCHDVDEAHEIAGAFERTPTTIDHGAFLDRLDRAA